MNFFKEKGQFLAKMFSKIAYFENTVFRYVTVQENLWDSQIRAIIILIGTINMLIL